MKLTVIAVIISLSLIGATIWVAKISTSRPETAINNVSLVDGQQIVEISAKGGYAPKLSSAQADVPTIIRVKTNATFDCSSAIVIPSLGYRNFLPSSGTTDIEIPPQKSGTKLQVLCVMGMYSFTVDFN